MTMNDFDEKMMIINAIGQKWVAEFTMPDGSPNMGICDHHHQLPMFVNTIREMGGKNIVIKDKTILFVDDQED